jgi:Fe-S-cluster containining protein
MSFNYPLNIHFDCTKCGLCCGDTPERPRHILLLEEEAKTITAATDLSKEYFAKEIKDNLPYRWEMKKTIEGKCFFLKDNHCSIYLIRPLICMFYPFELKFYQDQEKYIFNFTSECPAIGKGDILKKGYFLKLFRLAENRLK